MNMKIREVLYSGHHYNDTRKVSDFKNWMDEIVSRAPTAFQKKALIDITNDGDGYGAYWTEISVWYERPETDDEYKKRKSKEEYSRHRTQERERKRYLELKKKFEK